MTLYELKQEILKYQYMEDTSIIDVLLASIIATRLKLGDPVWMIIIGASSGGKSQFLRPLSMTDKKFMHRVDDLTENTFLSGGNIGGGKDPSLLSRVGKHAMLVISDLTVLFSKSGESRTAILSQFRMLYDGEMTKFVGTKAEPLFWEGYLGVIAGSTPSIYSGFEEVADMGERFIYYRMKEYDYKKATRLALGRTLYGKDLDSKLRDLYEEYLKEIIKENTIKEIHLSDEDKERILDVASLAERIRATTHMDKFSKEMDKLPVPAMPMRVAKQLETILKGLYVMRNGNISEDDFKIIEWCGYSLANEEKRKILHILSSIDYMVFMSTQQIADELGLSTDVTRVILQNMASIGIIRRGGGGNDLTWTIQSKEDYDLIRKIEGHESVKHYQERQLTYEENMSGKNDDF